MMKLSQVPLGRTVRFPYSGVVVTVMRHGESGTVVRPDGERKVVIDNGDRHVEFIAPKTAQVVCSSADVEVL